MNFMKTTKSFIRQSLSFMAGDTDGVVAEQNYRRCTAAFKSQIAVLEGKAVDAEDTLDSKKELLEKAKYPATKVDDTQRYIRNIVDAEKAVEDAQEALDNINESIERYQGYLSDFNKDVDVPDEAEKA